MSSQSYEDKFKELSGQFKLHVNSDLQTISTKIIKSYEFLEEFYKFLQITKEKATFLAVPKSLSARHIINEIRTQQDKYQSCKDNCLRQIPYVDIILPEDYKCPHGESYKDIHLFFFANQEPIAPFMLANLKRFNKLKVFI